MASRGSSAGGKKRKGRQKNVKRFMELREDLQLDGRLPVTPEGAIRDERVDPATQSEQQLPALVVEAVRNNWATPDHMKPVIVDAMCEPFLKRDTVVAPDGTVYELPPDRHLLKENAKVLAMLDKMQHDRDNPEDGAVNINNTVNVVAWDQMQQPPQAIQADQVEQRILDAANNKQEVKDGAEDQRKEEHNNNEGQPAQGQD